MNPRLPKEGSLDGVLSRNPDPPAMNAGMPRDPDLLNRLKRMQRRDALMGMGPEKMQAMLEGSSEGDYRHLFDTDTNPHAFRHGIQDAGEDEISQLHEELERIKMRREMEVGGASAPNPMIPDEIKYPTQDDIHRKSADIAFSMLKRDDICPECNTAAGDGSCSDCLDQQREEGRYAELWGEDDDETYVSDGQRMSPHSSMGLYDEEADPRLKEWLDDYFSGEEEPARTDLPYPQWKEQLMNQMYGLDTDDPITTAHDWDEDEARASHWMQSDSCDCNMSQADKKDYLQSAMMEALEDDPNADLEQIYGELAEEMAFEGGGQGRAKKWMKSTGRCGHCGGQSEMDEEGHWRQHF